MKDNTGKQETIINEPKEKVKPDGALYDCLELYPYFIDDIHIFIKEGYLEVTSSKTCKWLKSKTSLAEYFKWTGYEAGYIPGGFWAPIENTFGIKRHNLRRLAGKNGNVLKNDESRDFIKIKPLLEQVRVQEEEMYNERRIFMYIKHLFIYAEDEKLETIKRVLEDIAKIFIGNTDKNVQKRRLIKIQ